MVAALALAELENDTGMCEYGTSEYGMHEYGTCEYSAALEYNGACK